MASTPARTRVRLTADDRRRQLIAIGLRLLVSRPIHELSIDEVAAEAGISRGLLFHYFPTKRDYYVAVVRCAGKRLLNQTEVPDTELPEQRLRAVIDGFVRFIQRRRANYVALVRAASGGDEMVLEIFTEVRTTLADRVLDALEDPDPSALARLAVRGWLSMAEEMAIEASDDVVTSDELVDLLVEGLERLLESLNNR
jgi:AcrR family transcriptional regulator